LGGLRIEQLRRTGHKPKSPSPARDFQNALFVRLHDVFAAAADNRIISHVQSPSCLSPTGYVIMPRSFRGKHYGPPVSLSRVNRIEWQNAFRSGHKGHAIYVG
jgi:hypothetical protein